MTGGRVAALVAGATLAPLVTVIMFLTAGTPTGDTGGCGSVVPVSNEQQGGGVAVAASAALAAGWTALDAVTAVAVAGAESGYNPNAENPTSTAKGMWQIMMSLHEPKFNGADWRDPYASARVAHMLWVESGWQPWVAYTSGAYRSHLTEARAAVAAAGNTPVAATNAALCDLTSVVNGGVVWPEPKETDSRNYGNTGSNWANQHTGTDFSVACGTPVKASTGGTIVVDTTQAWAGTWLVKVVTAPHGVATWYAHMQQLTVVAGQTVAAGQVIGMVGTRGNSTGCHLHFEVHPTNGTIYQDPVNPSVWLDQHAGGVITVPVGQTGARYIVGTLNMLGHSHTRPGGNKSWLPPSSVRTPRAVAHITAAGVGVVALQEFEPIQVRQFRAAAGATWGLFVGADAEAVAWRNDTFALVKGWTVPITYFHGHIRHMPVVLLQSKITGQVALYTSFHNPATLRTTGNQQHWRDVATAREVALAAQAVQVNIPIFVLGDMNEKASAFCKFTQTGVLIAAAGGSNQGGCHPPTFPGIDWIFATPGTPFTGFAVDRSTMSQKFTDHALVMASVG